MSKLQIFSEIALEIELKKKDLKRGHFSDVTIFFINKDYLFHERALIFAPIFLPSAIPTSLSCLV